MAVSMQIFSCVVQLQISNVCFTVDFTNYLARAAIFLCCILSQYLCNSFHQKTSKFFVTLIVSKTFISLLDLDTKPCLLSPMSHVTKKYESQLNSCKRASAISSRFLARQLAGLWPAHMMCLHKRSFNIFRIDQQHTYQVLWTHQFLSFFLQYLCVWHESQGLTALAIFGV